MKHLVVIQPEGPQRVTAHSAGMPEVRATGETEAEAVDKVRQTLIGLLRSRSVVEIELSAEGEPGAGNPWLDGFGRSKDDPTFERYLAELERARREDDRK